MESKKQRVNGSGPSRRMLNAFSFIDSVPEEIIFDLKNLSTTLPATCIGSDNYKIAEGIDLESVFNVLQTEYKQILLQSHSTDQRTEFDYTNWADGTERIKTFLLRYFKDIYRLRISVTSPNHSIPWHIDADTSVVCRAQICVDVGNNKFNFQTKDCIEELSMEPGKMYFINTGWKHQVLNFDKTRIVAIFAFKFEDFLFPELLLKK
jgi:hypothetical protein